MADPASADPAVSVVVATNRASRFLPEALDSVAAQTFTDWELIVVDDGSPVPDDLAGLLRDAPGHRLLRQPASGVSVARNHGAAAARGRFLTFLDDDDLWHPDRLAVQVDALDRQPEVQVCHSGGWHIDSDGAIAHSWPAHPPDRAGMLAGSVPIPRIQTMLFRRDAFISLGGFNSALRMCEDHDLTLRALQLFEFCAVDRELAAYRRHPDNTSNVSNAVVRRAGENILRYQHRAALDRGEKELAELLARNLSNLRRGGARDGAAEMLADLKRRRYDRAWEQARWSASRDPLTFSAALVRVVGARMRRRPAAA